MNDVQRTNSNAETFVQIHFSLNNEHTIYAHRWNVPWNCYAYEQVPNSIGWLAFDALICAKSIGMK